MIYTKPRFIFFLILWLFFPCSAFAVINVDGLLDETEWLDAQSFPNFVVIDPLTLDTPRLNTQARVLSTPEGLAVAFICEQPDDETRTRTVTSPDTILKERPAFNRSGNFM